MPYDHSLLHPVLINDLTRIGRRRDGGYVIPARCITHADYLISAGICTDWSFELEFIKRSSLLDFKLIDATTTLREQFRKSKAAVLSNKSSYYEKLRAVCQFTYNIPRIPAFRMWAREHFIPLFLTSEQPTSSRGSKISLRQAFALFGNPEPVSPSSVFVKLDIEGAEWELVDDIIALSDHISCVAAEFHNLEQHGTSLNAFLQEADAVGLQVVHCHPNNGGGLCPGTDLPRLLEITLINNRLLTNAERSRPKAKSPIYIPTLDYPCVLNKPELKIPGSTMQPAPLSTTR